MSTVGSGADARSERLMFGWLQSGGENFDRAVDTSDAIIVSTRDGTEPRMGPRHQLGTLEIAMITSGGVDVEPLPAARHWRGVVLGYLAAGSLRVSQEGRAVDLAAGDFVFYTSAQRYRITAPGHHEYLVVRIPTSAIALRHSMFTDVIATDLSAVPSAPLLRAVLASLAQPDFRPSPAAGAHIADALVAAAHAVVADARHPGSATVMSLFHAFLLWIEEHLTDDEVSADAIASAHFLSTRYVRRVFAAHGATVSAVVRQRRLERIRTELLDPQQVRVPIGEIASRWGMRDAAVFSRAFAQQFGVSPRRYRALHLHQGESRLASA
ncbi:helix-turn-helix domain-containing protein [Microbacterium sp. SORGH_AS_0888]|uniref:helix-turn-helix domain-containing protein n=1 Tax=Microbacterium sp. SORGH_AS_0888 TaxID=3041791 RepID=UPI00277F6D37|nr:helix-turn-helix domain-containing protein [Microbacterium sp. SORGH_AS_0888]MDQ1129225.1 AraC-like DNA-binding protein [Microbacterium sp. SORGH_AS_0888]